MQIQSDTSLILTVMFTATDFYLLDYFTIIYQLLTSNPIKFGDVTNKIRGALFPNFPLQSEEINKNLLWHTNDFEPDFFQIGGQVTTSFL